jgi:hypothetical protein
MNRKKNHSFVGDIVLLAVAVGVFVLLFGGSWWAGQSPANFQAADDVLGRTYLEGPAAWAFVVVVVAVAGWLILKPKNKFGQSVVRTLDILLFGVVAVVLLLAWVMGVI